MFTDQERELIELEVAGTLQADKAALAGLIGRYHAVRIESSSVPLLYARNAVRYVERSAWVEDPALVLQLVEKYAVQAEFDAILQRLRQLPPPRFHAGNSSWETCLLALSLPFLGREKTRKAVKEFFPGDVGQAPEAHVLVVDGESKTGRSFTLDYVRYVASFPGGWSVGAVDFRTQVIAHLGPAELFQFLAEQIAPRKKITVTPPTEEQRSRWIIDLTGALVDLAAETGKSWIIVLDASGARTSPPRPTPSSSSWPPAWPGRRWGGTSSRSSRPRCAWCCWNTRSRCRWKTGWCAGRSPRWWGRRR